MQTNNGIPISLRILVPLLAALVINLSPLPHAVPNNLRLAAAAERQGDAAGAAAYYQAAGELQPWRTGLTERAAGFYYDSGAWSQVVSIFSGPYQQGELPVGDQEKLAEAYYQLKQYDLAVSVWQNLLNTTQAGEDLYNRVAKTQAMLGKHEDLLATYRQWIRQYPDNADVYYRLGLLLALRSPGEAAPMLALARTIDPQRAGSVDRLMEALATEENGDGVYALLQMGRAMSSIGEWEYARQAFEQAVELDPAYGEAWAFLAEAYQQLRMPSLQTIQKANELAPDSVAVKALTAMYWRRQNDPIQALQVLDQIITLEPDEEIWLVEKGYTLGQAGDLASALALFLEAARREPGQAQFQEELIRFCLQNNYEVRTTALPAARQYLIATAESSHALDMMGWVMLALEDTTSAQRYLVRALEKEPENASVHLHLGQLFLAINDLPQARDHLLVAAGMDEQDPQTATFARELLQRYFPGSI